MSAILRHERLYLEVYQVVTAYNVLFLCIRLTFPYSTNAQYVVAIRNWVVLGWYAINFADPPMIYNNDVKSLTKQLVF